MAHDTTADGRYGLASGTRYTTIADKQLTADEREFRFALFNALHPLMVPQRIADRRLIESVRRLVRAALDVERQRAFERGMEAFAAMPFRREIADSTPNRWTPGTFQGD